MGTSLSVAPFCDLVTAVTPHCPRLLLNRDLVGTHLGLRLAEGSNADNYRDAALLMSCDRGVQLLARYLGWTQDLNDLIRAYDHAHFGQQSTSSNTEPSNTAAKSDDNVDASTTAEDEEALDKSWRGTSQRSAGDGQGRSERGGAEMPGDVDHLVRVCACINISWN